MGFISGICIGIIFILMIGVINQIGFNRKEISKLKEEVKALNAIIVLMIAQKGGKNE